MTDSTEPTDLPPASLSELVATVQAQIDGLEAQARQAQAEFPKHALAARIATDANARSAASARALELHATLKRCRSQIEELRPLLAEARTKLEEEGREARDNTRRKNLQDAATVARRWREVAREAEELGRHFGQKIGQVVELGRLCHATFRPFMSIDQGHACAPDEGWLAQCILGALARSGGVDLHQVAQLSHLGLDALHTRESLTRAVDSMATLIESRFELELAQPEPPRRAPVTRLRPVAAAARGEAA